MFNESLPYKLSQVKSNKLKIESFSEEYIFKFYRHNDRCSIKYLVSIKKYADAFLTLDFYPKVNLTPKPYALDLVRDLKYRRLTRQNSFGYIGGTILAIIQNMQQETGIATWGVLAANLPQELSNYNNKRYKIYKEILRRTITNQHTIIGDKNNSAIFIIPNNQLIFKNLILEKYEKIFSETN